MLIVKSQNKGVLKDGFVADFVATDNELEDFFYEVGEAPEVKL